MSLSNLKQRLDIYGYYTSQYGNKYLRVARKLSDNTPKIINIKDFFCRVYFEENQYRLEDFKTQIPDDKYFDTESQVVAFIKNQFPL